MANGSWPQVRKKLAVHGYLNRVPSRRRPEREAGRNVEVMWLTGRLSPDRSQFDTADRRDPTPELAAEVVRLEEKIARLGQEMERLAGREEQMKAVPDRQIPLTDPDARSMATGGRGAGLVGATHFLTKTLPRVSTEMAFQVLAYNLTRVLNILGSRTLLAAIPI